MKNILLAGLLGALVVFIWSGISWMVLPFHNMTHHQMKNEDAMIESLKQNLGKTRVYFFPGIEEADRMNPAAMQAVEEKYKRGPIGLIYYQAEGEDMLQAKQLILGFLMSFICASFAAMLLSLAADKLGKYWQRVGFIGVIGLIAGILSFLTMWNWYPIQTKYTLLNFADVVFTWVLGGLVIGWRIKPTKQ